MTYYRVGRPFAILISCVVLLMTVSPLSAFAKSEKDPPLISKISLSVNPNTPLYQVDVDVQLASTAISCPAKLTLSLGPIQPQTRDDICNGTQTVPSDVHFLLPVFDPADPSHDLTPGSSITAQASIADQANQDRQSSDVSIPPAPIWIGVGDSYSSGHHQTEDDTHCVFLPQVRCHLVRNDPAFSWVTEAVKDLNDQLKVPTEPNWQMSAKVLANSAAKTGDMVKKQVPDMVTQLKNHRGSWNVVSMTGGANDILFSLSLILFYFPSGENGQPNLQLPWNIQNADACVNTQSLYERVQQQSGTIVSNLQEIVKMAVQADPNVRIVDIDYPYVMNLDNVCSGDRGPIHGAKAAVDSLDALHEKVVSPRVVHIDLRQAPPQGFGTTPIPVPTSQKSGSYLQLTRFYGYPHPDEMGQKAIANAAETEVTNHKF